MVQLEFANPFNKNDVPRVRLKRGVDDREETVVTPTDEESFERELDHFVRCVRGKSDVRTTFEEARADLALIIDLFREYQGKAQNGGR
jgi:predicted dehydrogenase